MCRARKVQNLELSFVRSYIKKREKERKTTNIHNTSSNSQIARLQERVQELLKTTNSLFYIFRKGGQ